MRSVSALLDPLHRFDHGLFIALHRGLHFRPLLALLAGISRLGNGSFWLALLLYQLVRGGPHASHAVLHMLATALMGVVIYKLIKERVGRVRPCDAILGLIPGVPPLDRWSFPSGHTLHAASFSVLMATWAPELFPLVFCFACLTGISRVALGLHYPLDVVAGAWIGSTLAVLMLFFFGPC